MIKIISSKKLATRKFFNPFFHRNFLALLAAVVIAFSASQAQAATFNVANLLDNGDNTTPIPGSLREKIIAANSAINVGGPDEIHIPTSTGNGTINLVTVLPAITDSVKIINDNTGSGRVELNGFATRTAAAPSIGFDIQAPDCEIWGFAINRFGDAGIRVGPNRTGTSNGSGTIIHQNYIGTNVTGDGLVCGTAPNTMPCGNINRGVWVDGASNVQVGVGSFLGHSNTISGNFGRGISVNSKIIGSTIFNGQAIIKNNYIGGVGAPGNTAIGNTQDGIYIAGSSGNVIGGSNLNNDINYIIGNDGSGISIIADVGYPASNNVIKGNRIGYTLGSNQAVGNSGSGIVIQGANNTIGGTTAEERNVIVGNKANGISINSSLATGNIVQGNYIGTGDGTNALGNNLNGIQISNLASGNTIGGTSGVTLGATPSCTGACNIIANNGVATSQTAKAGLYLDPTASVSNSIRANYIYNNGSPTGIGIDLGTPGSTANDDKDPDSGANNLQNFPVINSATTSGAIDGVLNSTASSTFTIDFFLNTTADGTRSQGRTYIGSSNVTTDANGNAVIGFNVPTGGIMLAAGQFVTATATSNIGTGNTSEFSAAQPVTTTTQPLGYEADVTPRSTGDGQVDATDEQLIERFSVGLDKPYTLNEGQRADCAPVADKGDRVVDALDVQASENYSVGLNPKTPASGPVTVAAPQTEKASPTNSQNSPAAPRTLSIQDVTTSRGNDVVVNILVDAAGDETGYTFSISYESARLSNPRITTGGIAGETIVPNAMTAGQIGFSVRFGGVAIPAGNNQVLVRVTFTVANLSTTPGMSPINFTSTPAPQRTSDINAQPLATTYVNGTVTINNVPTAAGATVSGRVVKSNGIGLEAVSIRLFDTQSGQTFYVITDEKGNYQFADNPVGHDYIITPISKVYTFNPTSRFLSLTEDLTVSTFTATGKKTLGR